MGAWDHLKLPAQVLRFDFTAQRVSGDAGERKIEAANEDATAGSHAVLRLSTVAGGGDPVIRMTAGAAAFHMGVDESDGILKIGLGSVVGTTPYVQIENGGMVGIGITPTSKLHIRDSGSANLRIDSGSQASLTIDSASSSNSQINMRQGGDSWLVRANGTSKDWQVISVPAGGVAIGIQRANNRVTLAAGLGVFGVAPPAAQPAKINDPSGGATTDAEARTAINAIIDVLEGAGLAST